ncbi:RND family efflux transporter MFP subunit [Thermovibrio guaymasensis]|uniref:RND family efflux transporter MFP subunit n=1 Tax=Thermovibrio guaymasensis TaxID=240167 RepID=A0A420W5W6_9BACT|nr:HlyD family efflux transporter periplasmic adaptor subunit [Thermovibrio guaymasensis]RKQ60552.1 RND family efflux transporter MFP subunit [Thermovibrio guaymasensis]
MSSRKAVLIFLVLILAGAVIGKVLIEKRKKELLSYPPPKVNPLPVEWAEVKEGALGEELHYFGRVLPYQYATLSTKVAGTVLKVYKSEGERFRKGEVLVEIDSSEISNNLASIESQRRAKASLIKGLEAQLEAAKVKEKNAEREYKRELFLFERKAVPREAVEKAENLYRSAQAQVKSLKAQIEELRNSIKSLREKAEALRGSLSYTKVVALKDGVVAQVLAYPGDVALPGKPLLKVFYPEEGMRVLVELPPEKAGEVEVGTTVSVSGAERGKVVKFYPAATPKGLVTLEVKLEKNTTLKPNQLVKVEIPTREVKGLIVPTSSLLHLKEGVFVLLIEKGEVKPVKVKVLKEAPKLSVVSGRLSPGQKVVVGRESALLRAYRIKRVIPVEELNG